MNITELHDGVLLFPPDTFIAEINENELQLRYKDISREDWLAGKEQEIYFSHRVEKLWENISIEDYLILKEIPISENIWVGRAYETYLTYLADKEPEYLDFSGQFNYGTNGLFFVDRPGKILILAQND